MIGRAALQRNANANADSMLFKILLVTCLCMPMPDAVQVRVPRYARKDGQTADMHRTNLTCSTHTISLANFRARPARRHRLSVFNGLMASLKKMTCCPIIIYYVVGFLSVLLFEPGLAAERSFQPEASIG